jgi:pimeloyl-ACP methyl ester carboxylesterase
LDHLQVHDLGYEFAPGSSALRSGAASVDRAVVFVHGFGGHPRKTWVDFQTLTEAFPWWDSVDLYFFKYRSVSDHIADSSARLMQFLDAIASRTPTYRSLILAAHSEGGLVARATMIEFVKRWEDGVRDDRTKLILQAGLRLFAPAHLGASPSGLLGLLAGSVALGDMVRAALGSSPAYNEMQQNSQLLGSIRSATEHFLEVDEYKWMAALRALVVWGEKDAVVAKGEFVGDRKFTPMPVPGKGHVSVCKPRSGYILPLEFVSYAWQPGTAVSYP